MALATRLTRSTAVFAAAAIPAAVLAYAATHGWAPLHRVDQSTADAMNRWAERTPTAVAGMKDVSTVFGPWILRAASVGIVVFLFVRRQRRLALWFATTMIAAGLLGLVLKLVVARSRPVLPDPVDQAGGYSFPSGHALNSFVFFGAVVLLVLPLVPRARRVWLWVGAILIVVAVGFSRVALGVHYVSDVVGGWIIGAGLLAVTTVAFESWRRDTGQRVPEVLVEGVSPEEVVEAATSGTPDEAPREVDTVVEDAAHASGERA